MANKRILIVEDNPDARRALSLRLQVNGFDLAFACDGISAISQARKEKPDLILLDLGLPAGDGFTVMERLRVLPALDFVPIIVVSAREEAVNRDRARRSGASGYFQKPTDHDVLLEGIMQALAGHPLWEADVA